MCMHMINIFDGNSYRTGLEVLISMPSWSLPLSENGRELRELIYHDLFSNEAPALMLLCIGEVELQFHCTIFPNKYPRRGGWPRHTSRSNVF